MRISSDRYMLSVLKRRFDMEAQRWSAALEGGFDVAVVVKEPVVLGVLESYLKDKVQESASANFELRLESTMSEDPRSAQTAIEPAGCSARTRRSPTLSLWGKRFPEGCAAIPFELPQLDRLLPSPSTMVTLILEQAQLDRYLESFDGRKMTLLRRVLEQCGPDAFFDAVVQVAYLAGYRGDDAAAHQILEKRLESSSHPSETRASLGYLGVEASSATDLSVLFEQLIQLPDPHDVLKAALAHYVFHKRNVTQAEASRILKVSRSTLQAHLQLATHLNVAALFSREAAKA